jgi:nucleotide-binding universal stress UspA family protein
MNLEVVYSLKDQAFEDKLQNLLLKLESTSGQRIKKTALGEGQAEEILRYCRKADANLLVISGEIEPEVKQQNLNSIKVELIDHTRIPVLVIPDKSGTDFSKDAVRTLVADDMQEESRSTLETALRIADAMKNLLLEVVFVGDFRQFKAQAEFLEVFTLSAGIESPYLRSDSLSDFHRDEMIKAFKQRIETVRQRVGTQADVIDCRLLDGEIVEALAKEISRMDAELVIFGRHHGFHQQWPPFGHVSQETMLNFRCPIMIVPQSISE